MFDQQYAFTMLWKEKYLSTNRTINNCNTIRGLQQTNAAFT